MPIDTEGKSRKLATRTFLLLMAVLGLSLILLMHSETAKNWDSLLKELGSESGKALIVAGLLGLVIDSALKQDLIRDAVASAIGYLLPDPLKAELIWVYDQKFMVEQTFVIRLDHKPDDNLVVFHGHYTRIIHNTSGEKAIPKISGGVDEWFSPKTESKITRCGVTRNGTFIPIQPTKNIVGLKYECRDRIELEPDDSLQVEMAYAFCGPENGMEILTHNYPINQPLVTLDVPDTLKARVVFSHRAKTHEEPHLESGHISRRLPGVLLPFTDIRIYWNRASDIEARTKVISWAASQADSDRMGV